MRNEQRAGNAMNASLANSRYNRRRLFDQRLGEAELIHRRNTLHGDELAVVARRTCRQRRPLCWLCSFLGLGVATTAGAQNASTPAKPAASATTHTHKTSATKPVASLGAPVKAYGIEQRPDHDGSIQRLRMPVLPKPV